MTTSINTNKLNKTFSKTPKKSQQIGIMGNAIDYSTYSMNPRELITGFIIGAIVGYLAMYLVFHSSKASLMAAIVGGFIMLGPYKNTCIEKRKKELLLQFRDLMESLVSSYSAGCNPQTAFENAYIDMENLFGPESYMAREVGTINAGIKNGYSIEAMLNDFAQRAGLEDIKSFVEVFNISFRRGGDMKKVLFDTRMVISEKIEMEQEMKVQLRGSVNELNVLIVVPVIIDLLMNMDGGTLAGGNTVATLYLRIIAVVMFVSAYAMGRYMLKKNERVI